MTIEGDVRFDEDWHRLMTHLTQTLLLLTIVGGTAWGTHAAWPDGGSGGKFYQIVDGKVDARTYNGFRRYHAGCNHCHGPDGTGSTFGPSLVKKLIDVDAFRQVVREGRTNGTSIMKGFADDPNVAPYIDDIYGYLQARADGALGRGRPTKLEP